MVNKTRKQNKLAKLIKIKRFDHLVNKPAQPKKGISYAIERAENIDAKTGKKMDGDIYKKYEDGVLKRQVFVPKMRVKKLIQKSLAKVKKTKRITVIGGAAQQNPQVVYVQAPPAQAQPQQIMVQDKTTSGQFFKEGIFKGVGFGLAHVFISAIFSGDN
jgi:hypothetical protein